MPVNIPLVNERTSKLRVSLTKPSIGETRSVKSLKVMIHCEFLIRGAVHEQGSLRSFKQIPYYSASTFLLVKLQCRVAAVSNHRKFSRRKFDMLRTSMHVTFRSFQIGPNRLVGKRSNFWLPSPSLGKLNGSLISSSSNSRSPKFVNLCFLFIITTSVVSQVF